MENRDYRLSSGNTDRPVLVLGHSLGTNFSLWDPVIGRLEQNFRLLFYNPHPMHAGAGNASVESRGKQLIELLDYLGFQQIDFCGVSMSGLIGQWVALAKPKCIRNLILVNTAARVGNPQAWQERINLVRETGLAELAHSLAARWFSPDFAVRNIELIERFAGQLCSFSPEGYLAACEAIRDSDFRDRVAGITTRTLIIAGRYDRAATVADAEFLHQQIDSSQLVVFPCGHLACVETPGEFTRVLSDFLLRRD